jgi:hypothetical protein
VIRYLIVLAFVMTGCASKSEAAPCNTKQFSHGLLSDCGSTVTYDPGDANLAARHVVVDPGTSPLRMNESGTLVECRATQTPEGRWVICADGLSRLERAVFDEPVAHRHQITTRRSREP